MSPTQKVLTVWSLAAVLACPGAAFAQGTIKVGVLHSLSGTMAISETTLKDTVLMLIDEQNKKGGLLGKKLEAVLADPASAWRLLRRRPASFWRRTRSPLSSGAGRRCPGN